jgi:hypothetical protein
VASWGKKPPVTASGMFQRRNGAIQRLRPGGAENTTMAIVNVNKSGASKVFAACPFQRLDHWTLD